MKSRCNTRMKYAKELLDNFSLFGNPRRMRFKTRFTSVDEFYPAVNKLIEWLYKDGHLEDSQKLRDAMIAGAIGSEILGNIMLALKSMKGNYSPELRKEINECYEFARNHRRILGLDK